MPDQDIDYLQGRAEAEIEMARTATHPAAVRAHYLLAGFYLDRVHGEVDDAVRAQGVP